MSHGPVNPDRPLSHLEIVDKRLNILVEDLARTLNRLRANNDKKLGQVPEEIQKTTTDLNKKSGPTAGGIIGNVLIALDMLDGLRIQLHNEVERVEVL